MSITQTEFKRRIEQHVSGDLESFDDPFRYDIRGVYDIARRYPSVAREFIEQGLSSSPTPQELLLISVVNSAYQMVTGDGSFWRRVEKSAQDVSYLMYEWVTVLSPYWRARFMGVTAGKTESN